MGRPSMNPTTTTTAKESILRQLYSDPRSPAGFSGVNQLLIEAKKRDSKIKRKDVENFLEGEETYTLHKARRLRFKRAKTHAAGYMTHLQADLGDFQRLEKKNRGYNYLLVAIDVLSHHVFVAPVKRKVPSDMMKAFERIFEQMPMLPHNLFTDRGLEFDAAAMKDYFRKKGVIKHSAQSKQIKAALAERCIRTIKTRLYRYFSEKETLNWIDVIEQIAEAINHSVNRTTGMRPVDVNFRNAQNVWERVYGESAKPPTKKPRYAVDDTVRIAREKTVFRKGYLPTFSDKLYDVAKVKRGHPDEYMLYDEEGEPIKGRFYAPELAKTRWETAAHVEKILKRRTRDDGTKEALVQLRGYKFPRWFSESDIIE